MAEEWRELLRTVQETLQEARTATEAIRLIGLAVRKLDARANLLRRIRLGVAIAVATGGFVDPEPVGVCPSEILHDICREIMHRSSIHCMANHVLPLCCQHMDILPSGENCQSWNEHKKDAVEHGEDAQKRFRNAASSTKAAQDAIGMASSLPEGSPLSMDWILAAEQLLNRAIKETDLAVDQAYMMRCAISQQLVDAGKIIRI